MPTELLLILLMFVMKCKYMREEGTIRCYQLFPLWHEYQIWKQVCVKVMRMKSEEPWDRIGQSETRTKYRWKR